MTSEFEGACRRLESTLQPRACEVDEVGEGWCYQFDNCLSCRLRCLEDIKAAHERELEDVRREMDTMAMGYDGELAAMYDMYEDKLDALEDELAANRKYEYGYTVEDAYSSLRDDVKRACERDPNVWDQAILVGGLESLGNAYDRAIEHSRKEEYHRGYEDGLKARDVGMWQLEHERREAVRWLREYDVDDDSYDAFARALGVGQDECIRTRLIHLLGGDSIGSAQPIEDARQESTDELKEKLEVAYAKNRSLKAHVTKMQNGRHGWHIKYAEMDARYRLALNDAAKEYRSVSEQRDKLAQYVDDLSNDYSDAIAERDNLLALLRDAAKEHKDLLDKYLSEPWEAMQPMDDEHMSMLGWMRALDHDGVPIRMGDVVRSDICDPPLVVDKIVFSKCGNALVCDNESGMTRYADYCNHVQPKPDPIEQVIRDLTLGSMAETEAIERLHEIIGS